MLSPPIIWLALARVRGTRSDAEWVYCGAEWPQDEEMRGWNETTVVERASSEWPALVATSSGPGPIEPQDVVAHNTIMSFAHAFSRAARGRDTLSFLDWGGGVGRYSLIARSLFPEVTVDYHCRDLALINAAGRKLQPDATYHDSDAGALGRHYDFVMASGSLHYSEDWRVVLARLADVADPYLLVTRQPFVSDAPSYVVVQRPAVSGYYDTEYPGWVLNRGEFITAARSLGYELEREFITGEELYVEGAPEQAIYRGFLWRRAS